MHARPRQSALESIADLWEDAPEPWAIVGQDGTVSLQNQAMPDGIDLPDEVWAATAAKGIWRGTVRLGEQFAPAIAMTAPGPALMVTVLEAQRATTATRAALDALGGGLLGVWGGRVVYRDETTAAALGRDPLGEPIQSLPRAARLVMAGYGDEDAKGTSTLQWRRLGVGDAVSAPLLLLCQETRVGDAPTEQPSGARLAAIGELAAGIAHELNQPLNVITGYIELLQDDALAGDEATHALEVMARAADRMAALVRQLRDYTRAGLETLRPVDLRDLLRIGSELSSRATKVPVPVQWSAPAEPIYLLGDPGRLEQLFINLLANARQATEAAGGAAVSVRAELLPPGAAGLPMNRAGLAVEVTDQGRGVPADLRDRIFEPFFTTKGRAGTGLGLSICDRIAREHQGQIQVEDAPGGGATFRILLPRYSPI